MAQESAKPYDPKATEPAIYRLWEESGFFNPDTLPVSRDAKPFCIIMPPPNANGHLHAGHAMFVTIEDLLTRYHRMRGDRTLWLPGADHAGFETQVVYEKKLEKEGRSRFEMDPKQLYDEIMAFTLENKVHMESELRALGASCDWSREKFTLDPKVIQTVYGTFQKLFKDGLVYRGKRIVSWCSKHQTSFSDLEIADVERTDPFYYLQYGPFVISTARPETKFGDKYVVVHPDDERYAKYKEGDTFELEWINGPVTATIVKDAAIDPKFGTGAMTITPWHDATDFEIAERHGLDREQVIDERGRLLPIAGEFGGMKIEEARKKIVEKLQAKGLIVKTEDAYRHVVRTCYKCGTVIEPQIKEQWFVKMRPLADRAIRAIEEGEIVFVPEHYKKITLHWLENIVDWNISRQIVWGIPIPAKICTACGAGVVDLENNTTSCSSCGGAVREDVDTFDTWFSSGQWPFITLGYPAGEDFKQFYPTSVMETAGEIIFFWVTRMIMLGLYVTHEVPFRTVYLHGLVLDAKGNKMSKSKGNVINPLELTSKYGTDALRMALVMGNTPGTSLALSEDKIRGYRNFANKLWNIARFLHLKASPALVGKSPKYTAHDEKLLEEFKAVHESVTKHLESFDFHLASYEAYHYVWHRFADVVLEEAKPRLEGGDEATRESAAQMLSEIFRGCLKLLHPITPFVTEAIFQELPEVRGTGKLLMIEEW